MLWTDRTRNKLQAFTIVDQLLPTISDCRDESHHLYTCPVFLSEIYSSIMRVYKLIRVRSVAVNNRTDGDSHTTLNHSSAYAAVEHSPGVLGRAGLNSGQGQFVKYVIVFLSYCSRIVR